MRAILTLAFFVVLAFALTACPQPESGEEGGVQTGGGGGAQANPDAYKSSKLATLGKAKLGMTFDEVKALYPEDSGYKFEDPMPDAENPLMAAASPASEEIKLHEGYGILGGEVVYIYQAGPLTDEEFNAKIEEFTAAYGESSPEVPEILTVTKFYAGDPEPPAEAETPAEGEETAEGEDAEAAPPAEEEPRDDGIKNELPENAVFWTDSKAKLVFIAASENGEASFMLLRTDKIDEQFELFNKAMEEMYQKMMDEMMKQMQDQGALGEAPPAEGGTPAPPAEGGN